MKVVENWSATGKGGNIVVIHLCLFRVLYIWSVNTYGLTLYYWRMYKPLVMSGRCFCFVSIWRDKLYSTDFFFVCSDIVPLHHCPELGEGLAPANMIHTDTFSFRLSQVRRQFSCCRLLLYVIFGFYLLFCSKIRSFGFLVWLFFCVNPFETIYTLLCDMGSLSEGRMVSYWC